ncbi:MAG: methyltransferase domain-containing protein [Acidimicrobiales bacterium]
MTDVRPDYSGYVAWKRWEDLFSYSAHDAAYFSREIGARLPAASSVAEIGFGSGRLLSWLRDNGYNVRGAEIIPELLAQATLAGFKVFDLREGAESGLWSDPVGAFVAFDVFEHLTVSEITEMLVLMGRVLPVGGRVIVRVPNGQSPFGLAFQADDLTHRTILTAGTLAQIVDLANHEMTGPFGEGDHLRLVEVQNQAQSFARGPRGLLKRVGLRLAEGAFFFLTLPYRYERFDKVLYGGNIVAVLEKVGR